VKDNASLLHARLKAAPSAMSAGAKGVDVNFVSASLVNCQPFVSGTKPHTVQLAHFSSFIPTLDTAPDLKDAAGWAQYCTANRSLFGEDSLDLKFISENTAGYDKQKASYVSDFFLYLQKHEHWHPMVDFVDSPWVPDQKLLRFFAILGGPSTPVKISVLNQALLCFSMSLRKKKSNFDDDHPGSLYQMGVMKFIFDCLFATFRQNGMCVRRPDVESQPSSFSCYIKIIGKAAADFREDYGRRTNRALVDVKDDEKVRKSTLRVFDTEHADEHLRVLSYGMMGQIQYRGFEVSLVCF
jgi:hypothetical protein